MFGLKRKQEEPQPDPYPWRPARDTVGHCTVCGNPIFEYFERQIVLAGYIVITKEQRSTPPEIIRTCACTPSARASEPGP